jgi:predicted dithiol-disulfide oxidoreductase (DUF899 family)
MNEDASKEYHPFSRAARVSMQNHLVVGHDQWLAARAELLAKEKEFTRLRDQLSRQRRELPWEAVTKEYVFEGPNGKATLAELFEGKSQLVIYHFMFGPDAKPEPSHWPDAGCEQCSFWADNFNGIIVHLNHRDVTMIAVSRAPLAKLEAYKMISTSTTTFPSHRKSLPRNGLSTITWFRTPAIPNAKRSACSTRMRAEKCSTHIRRMRVGSTC